MAVGSQLEKNVAQENGLELDERGYIKIDENCQTSKKGVFAGGDAAGYEATVSIAARSGRDVAEKIHKILSNEIVTG